MKLTLEGIKNKEQWQEAGIGLPSYDVEKVAEETKKAPVWVHFGAGNIFRIFIGGLADTLLNNQEMDKGITCVETFDFDVVDKIYKPYDNLVLAVTLKADGSTDKKVLGSLTEAVKAQSSDESQWNRLKEIFRNPGLQMISFTITEKGYALKTPDGEYFPGYIKDFEAGPGKGSMFLSRLTELLLCRYKAGSLPLAVVSMDNCSHNGEKIEAAVTAIAAEWVKRGYAEQGFADYLSSDKVSFPWSMIDKITPRPDAGVAEMLKKDGYEDTDVLVTDKHTYIASFVNAEECEYLVIEDDFPNGRPALEKAGVYFTDRETVNKVEKMKVCTCLNPLHTALAVFGCLLSYTLIADEMKDEDLVKLVKTIGYKEGLPVVVDPGIINPKHFIDEVVEKRIPNPFMPDTPQRIATDTSQKLPIRFGETIKAYMASKDLDIKNLKCIPLVFAAWLRYVMGIDDKGNTFEPSSDPLLSYAQEKLKGVKLGDESADIGDILSNEKIFGVDLVAIGMSDLVMDYFLQMIKAPGAVREVLHRTVNC